MIEDKKNVLVTGGHGFIGSHLVDSLISKGYDVYVVDDHSSSGSSTITTHTKSKNFDVNICDFQKLDDFFKENHEFEHVFHLAADSKNTFPNINPVKTQVINSVGTANLLQYVNIIGVRSLIFASCASVYGVANKAPFDEDMPVDNLNPIAVSKISAEAQCDLYHRMFNVNVICLRIFNVYGDGALDSGDCAPLVSKMIKQKADGQKYTVFGDGNQSRDFVHVDDVVTAMIAAAETENEDVFGEVFNVGSGQEHSVMDVIDMVSGKDKRRVNWNPPRLNEPSRSCSNINKIKKYLDWEPSKKLKDYIDSKNS